MPYDRKPHRGADHFRRDVELAWREVPDDDVNERVLILHHNLCALIADLVDRRAPVRLQPTSLRDASGSCYACRITELVEDLVSGTASRPSTRDRPGVTWPGRTRTPRRLTRRRVRERAPAPRDC